MNCKFWSQTHPVCKLGLYGGMPSHDICLQCIELGQNNPKYARQQKKKEGLGDVVHSVAQPIAKAIDGILGTNIQGCGGCQKRRRTLNEIFPFKEKAQDEIN